MSEAGPYDFAEAEAAAIAYDSEARATGWLGPQVALGMLYEHLLPAQSLLDLGIGTGLASVLCRKAGLKVSGLDINEQMLDVCRWKGFEDLVQHDLTERPYPYPSESFDHSVCLGVLPFLADLSPVFLEVGRVLRTGGMLVFMTLDRAEHEDFTMVVGPEHTKTGGSVTMYRHSAEQIAGWIDEAEFTLVERLLFAIYRDASRREALQAACYLARKGAPAQ